MSTPAHDQNETHHYRVHYPAHPPRESDPHYVDFEAFRKRTHATAQCAIGLHRNDFCECAGGLELHHAHVEFSLQNGVDLAWLEKDYPGISDPTCVGAWVESAANLLWLCVLPGSPVLMADGSHLPIEYVRPGDYVVTHDGSSQLVEGISRKRYRGEIASFGSASFTFSHRVLTDRGWLSAAEILGHVRMHGPDVILLRSEQQQVVGSVVGSIAVEMVDALPRSERAANNLLHDVTVLQDPSLLTVAPDDHADIPSRGDMATTPIGLRTLLPVEADDSTGIGAVEVRTGPPMRRAVESATTNFARPQMRWIAAMLTSGLYNGWVHDLSVSHNHSFIAGGIVVHNCEFHHRGHGGVHVASASDFEAEKYVKGLIS